MFTISEKGKQAIKKHEALRLKAYKDTSGVWTIGYGNTFYEDGTKVKPGDVITADRANKLFENIVGKFSANVLKLISQRLTQNQFDSIVSFFSQLPGKIGGFFSSAWSSARGAWSGAVGFFSGVISGIIGFFASIPGRIRGFFVDAFNAIRSINWVQVGADIIAGIVRGLNPGSVVSKMKEIASSAMDTVKNFLGIKSPSRVFMAIGGDIMAGWTKGLDAKPVVNAMDSATSQIMKAASPFNAISGSGTVNVVSGNKAFDGVNGSSFEKNIGTINNYISSDVDADRFIRRLNEDQEQVSGGIVPVQRYA